MRRPRAVDQTDIEDPFRSISADRHQFDRFGSPRSREGGSLLVRGLTPPVREPVLHEKGQGLRDHVAPHDCGS